MWMFGASPTFVVGVLACLDGYMNIAMEQTEEFVEGQLKAKYGDCFIRGNNGTPSYDSGSEHARICHGFRVSSHFTFSVVHFNAQENIT